VRTAKALAPLYEPIFRDSASGGSPQ
jgi:hypothetical protein